MKLYSNAVFLNIFFHSNSVFLNIFLLPISYRIFLDIAFLIVPTPPSCPSPSIKYYYNIPDFLHSKPNIPHLGVPLLRMHGKLIKEEVA